MKVGVISLYYNNDNYGGLLQSYALVAALDRMGLQGEQICFDSTQSVNPIQGHTLGKKEKLKKYGMGYLLFMIGLKCKGIRKRLQMQAVSVDCEQKQLIQDRIECFKRFEQNVVPHSEKIYSSSNIKECVGAYDVFLCGSDQIWNPSHIRDEYLLKFVPAGKKKISYAASISRNDLTDFERDYICNALENFDAISVREKTAVPLLSSKALGERVTWMPDPTLLLTRRDWEALMGREKVDTNDTEDYILCYFLGDNLRQRRIVMQMAQKKNLRIVTFPHVSGRIQYSDTKFRYDRAEYECSPAKFINLVKHARYIMTDSFHAIVFSIIFQRDFIAFCRERTSYENNMISRINDLLGETGLDSRLVKNSVSEVSRVMSQSCDFSKAEKWLAENRERGLTFLQNAIK